MIISQYVAPISECVSLESLKLHLKVDSGTLADNLSEVQSIYPGSHAVTVGYTLVGAAVAVISDTAMVMVQSGTNVATGAVDVKIQESDTGAAPWTDWTGGAFTQITTANDNATYEKEYTGTKAYIRTIAQVLLAACEFGTTIIQYALTSAEDSLLTTVLAAARQHIEHITGRQIMSATWDYSLQHWPHGNSIKLPFGNLQSVTSLKYTDSSGVQTTLVENTDYEVVTNGEQCGKIVLPYGVSWPSATLHPENPIVIRYVCGYASAAMVPEMLQVAIKFAAQNMWRHGGDDKAISNLIENLTYNYRIHDEF